MHLFYDIKKNKKGEEFCITPCPLGKITLGNIRIMIGSCNCPNCKLYQADDQISQVLTCRLEKKMTVAELDEIVSSGRGFR